MTFHNLSQQEVQQELIQTYEDFFTTQTTVSITGGTTDYSLPTNCIKVRRVEDYRDTSAPTEIKVVRMGDAGVNGLTWNSQASFLGGYFIRGNQICFADTPTTSYPSGVRLFYVPRLADILTASDSSPIPVEFHRALVWGIVKMALISQQSDASVADKEYERALGRMKINAENRQIQQSRSVKRVKVKWG
jgi:hypothetical protein